MKRVWIELLAIAVVALLAVVGFLAATLERVDDEVDTEPESIVAVDPFYALEELLHELEVVTTASYGTGDLPSTDTMLFVVASERDRSAEDVVAWVESGGTLVLTPTPDDDPWLQALGVTWKPGTEDARPISVVDSDGARAVLDLDPTASLAMDDPAWETWAEDPDDGSKNVVALAFQRGDGWVTVLSTAEFLENDDLAHADHAPWFWDAFVRAGQPPSVRFVIKSHVPGLLGLLWTRARPAVVSGIVVLVAWLYTASRRFGPPLAAPALARRSVLEHTAAIGRFLWDHGHGDVLVSDAREAVLRRLAGRVPDRAGSALDAWVEQVAKATGSEVGLVREALVEPYYPSGAAIVRTMQALGKLVGS